MGGGVSGEKICCACSKSHKDEREGKKYEDKEKEKIIRAVAEMRALPFRVSLSQQARRQAHEMGNCHAQRFHDSRHELN